MVGPRVICLFMLPIFVSGMLGLREGAPCSVKGVQGSCVDFFRCTTVIADMTNKKFPEICSFKGLTPIICCTSCDLVKNISNSVITPTGHLVWKNGLISWEKCLEYSEYARGQCHTKAVLRVAWNDTQKCGYLQEGELTGKGGRVTEQKQYPHMALLGYGVEDQTLWLCGGSLISERFILTAGQCTSSAFGPVTYAALGVLQRSDPHRLWQKYRIDQIIQHPEYKAPSKYNDIALLRTERNVALSSSIYPACLGDARSLQEVEDQELVSTGWGSLGHRQPVDTLQVARLEPYQSEECASRYLSDRSLPTGFNSTSQTCFGSVGKSCDICTGDRGGPIQFDSSICMHVIKGVNSFVETCGVEGVGLYTRVEPYSGWIAGVVWP